MASHDRKLDEHILEILEDERDAMKAGDVKLAQNKFNEALGVMREIKSADFEMPSSSSKMQVPRKIASKASVKSTESSSVSKTKSIDLAASKGSPKLKYHVSDLEQEHAGEQTDSQAGTFSTLKASVKSLLQKVKGDPASKVQAENLLREHHGLLQSLKSLKVDEGQPNKEVIQEMEKLQSALIGISPPQTGANLEKDAADELNDMDEFKQLKSELRSKLSGIKSNAGLRVQAETVLKKFHPLLVKIKEMKNTKHLVSKELLLQMKALRGEITSALASTSSTLEKQQHIHRKQVMSKLTKELERVRQAQIDLEE